MAEGQLDLLIESTRWFIAQDPTSISLTPSTTSRGPGGGFIRTAGTPRTAAQVKLIGVEQDGVSRGEGGVDRQFNYTIVGMPDLQISVDDTFTVDGNKFIVTAILPKNGYEVKAKAIQFSKVPSDG